MIVMLCSDDDVLFCIMGIQSGKNWNVVCALRGPKVPDAAGFNFGLEHSLVRSRCTVESQERIGDLGDQQLVTVTT
jgi:hypothetical protein